MVNSLVIKFQKTAATAAPANGAIINTHTCLSAIPPKYTAGAKLRAGLILPPVNGMATMYIATNVNPIIIPPK